MPGTERNRGSLQWSYPMVIYLIAGFGATGSSALSQFPSASTSNIAHGKPASGSESRLGIVLRVYDYAHVPPVILSEAEQEAAEVFQGAGIQTKWLSCRPPAAEFDNFPSCKQPLTRLDFALDVLDHAMTKNIRSHGEALGLALECTGDVVVCRTFIFYDRLTDWTSDGGISAHRLLGYALAHEIGHLLLGANSHSRDGIMRSWWTPKEFMRMGRRSLYFTSEQRDRIRAAVQSRIEYRAPPGVQVPAN